VTSQFGDGELGDVKSLTSNLLQVSPNSVTVIIYRQTTFSDPTSRVCLRLAKFIVENMKIRLNAVRRTSLELAAAVNLDGDLYVAQERRRAATILTIPQRSGKGRSYLQPLMKEERA